MELTQEYLKQLLDYNSNKKIGHMNMKKWEQYKFKINAYTPDTMPMARCAKYLAELADILGEENSVHFIKVATGSTQLVHKIESEAIPKVRDRIRLVSNGEGTAKAMRAYREINKMLQEDNGTAFLAKGKAHILRFPGKEEESLKFTSVQQRGEVDGEVIRIGGSREIVPILLEVEGKEISGCHANRTIAKELAKNLFEPVRLFGEGRWNRDNDGVWTLDHFVVDDFKPLEKISLSETILALREIKGEWDNNSLYEILESRCDHEERN
jgi:hypothetical protein